MSKILNDGRKCCKAIVTVSVEVVVKPVWGSHRLDEVYTSAAKDAKELVAKACNEFGEVKEVKVEAVLTECHEVAT